MPRITVGTIVKLLIASLCVGLLLAFLNITPQQLYRDGFARLEGLFAWAVSVFGEAFSYILLGAVVVVPIWLAFYLLKALKARR